MLIAVTIARKVRYFKTAYRIRPEEWKNNQVSNHPNAMIINRGVRKQIDDIEADILARDAAGETGHRQNDQG